MIICFFTVIMQEYCGILFVIKEESWIAPRHICDFLGMKFYGFRLNNILHKLWNTCFLATIGQFGQTKLWFQGPIFANRSYVGKCCANGPIVLILQDFVFKLFFVITRNLNRLIMCVVVFELCFFEILLGRKFDFVLPNQHGLKLKSLKSRWGQPNGLLNIFLAVSASS